MVKVVVFDLYGTLLYLSEEKKPYRKLFVQSGLSIKQYGQARDIALTENFDNLSAFVKHLGYEHFDNTHPYELALAKELTSATLFPETKTVLETLKKQNMKLGLLSNVASPYKQPFFDYNLQEYFDTVIFSCDTGMKKPQPEIYQHVCDQLGVTPSDVLMIGDTLHTDVEGPKIIGMRALHLDRNSFASKSISSLEDTLKHIF